MGNPQQRIWGNGGPAVRTGVGEVLGRRGDSRRVGGLQHGPCCTLKMRSWRDEEEEEEKSTFPGVPAPGTCVSCK